MKLFVATDIHGSAYWAERIVNAFKQSNADKLILLGDVYNHGPRNPFPRDYAPMRVAQAFNEIAGSVVAVKGNCDSDWSSDVCSSDLKHRRAASNGGGAHCRQGRQLRACRIHLGTVGHHACVQLRRLWQLRLGYCV